MAKSNALKMKLPSVDDLFYTEESRQEAKLPKIYDIPISEIDDFPDHPFKVRDDEDMDNLIESIRVRGVITPATVRKKPDGRYEWYPVTEESEPVRSSEWKPCAVK